MADVMTNGGQTTTAHASVSKGMMTGQGTAGNYPNYFYNPKENLFDSKRQSRYDKGKPKAFHLTQPDTNLAKFLFNHQEVKRKQ